MDIELQIDQLVLHGVAHHKAEQLRQAIRYELAQLLKDTDDLPQNLSAEDLSLTIPTFSDPLHIARAVAKQIYKQLWRT